MLAERCGICGSSRWCGRPCRNAPSKPVLANTVLPVTNVTNKTAASDKDRVMRWRKNNPDRYRATQRDLMRKRRAANKGT
jgi:hypothetical protein